MRSDPAPRAVFTSARRHPGPQSFAGECGDALVKILAYGAALVLIGVVVFTAANPLTDKVLQSAAEAAIELGADTAPSAQPAWSAALRSQPAFAVSQLDLPGKLESTEVLRNSDGGRKDVIRFAAPGEPPAAEIEVYRLGDEVRHAPPAAADLAARMDPGGIATIQPAGLVETKFGTAALFDLAGSRVRQPGCLGFIKTIESAGLRLSGWTCQGDTLVQRSAAAACLLDRLVLLSAGNDAAIAETFARAELRRTRCDGIHAQPIASADWITDGGAPGLRGRLGAN